MAWHCLRLVGASLPLATSTSQLSRLQMLPVPEESNNLEVGAFMIKTSLLLRVEPLTFEDIQSYFQHSIVRDVWISECCSFKNFGGKTRPRCSCDSRPLRSTALDPKLALFAHNWVWLKKQTPKERLCFSPPVR